MDTEKGLAETKSALSKHRILVLEDDDGLRRTYCTQLVRAGYLVDDVSNLQQALERLTMRTYHVGVIDIMLNGPDDTDNRDGVVVLDAIRDSRLQVRVGGEKTYAGTRAIALTGQDKPEFAAGLLKEHGANDYIDKRTYQNAITDELIKRIREQTSQVYISLYGERPVISFLAGPHNEAAWVDICLRTLQVRGGYAGLERFFHGLCDSLAPLAPSKGTPDPTEVHDRLRVVAGKLWSKALGLPILIIATPEDATLGALRSEFPEMDPDHLLLEYSGQGLTGRVFELKNSPRSDFNLHIG